MTTSDPQCIFALTPQLELRRQVSRALHSHGRPSQLFGTREELIAGLQSASPSLIILDADAQSPQELGLLIQQIRERGGTTQLVVLSFRFQDRALASMLAELNVENLIAKHIAPRALYPIIDERELSVTCEKLLRRDIFGINKYVGAWGTVVNESTVRSVHDKNDYIELFESYVESLGCPSTDIPDMVGATEELILNALVHAPRSSDGDERYRTRGIDPDLMLAADEAIRIVHACDGQRLMVAVGDRFGAFTRAEMKRYVFERLNVEKLPVETKLTGSGLGLAITLRSVHQLIINVHETNRTEVIAGWYVRVANSREFKTVGRSINVFWAPRDTDVVETH